MKQSVTGPHQGRVFVSSHLIHLSKDLNSKFFFITSQSIYYLNIDLERILKRHLVKKSFLKASLKFIFIFNWIIELCRLFSFSEHIVKSSYVLLTLSLVLIFFCALPW